jgi:4-aminobutyrate aminotransferase/(S)-3-amino-2-methylpropionate transaminase
MSSIVGPPRGVRTDLPGPLASALLPRGAFDLQAGYRSIIIDDEKSAGCSLVDVDGNVYLDLFSSFALGALGYNHPDLMAVAQSPAFARAAANPTSTPFLTTSTWLDFMSALESKYAPPGMARVFCVDGGGEGVESAMKLAFMTHAGRARAARGEPANPLELPAETQDAILHNLGSDAVIIGFEGAFHGRGFGALAVTHSKVSHKADIPSFAWPTAPFPAARWPLAEHAEANAAREADALVEIERIFDAHAGRVAAVIVEPMQSEGGDRHASAGFFAKLQAMARAAGAALIFDEVQTGAGISGSLWCHEQFALPHPPDLVTFGKKMQLGGCFCGPEYAVVQFGRMYQTRNGDRARAMLALATLQTIERDGLLANVRDTGAHFLAGLEDLARRFPKLVTEPRGRGFLLAFDLPTTALRDAFLKAALRRGVFASYTGSRSVRLRPHLITGPADADEALRGFDAALREVA